MFDPSSFANPTPLAHADTSRDVLPRGGLLTTFWIFFRCGQRTRYCKPPSIPLSSGFERKREGNDSDGKEQREKEHENQRICLYRKASRRISTEPLYFFKNNESQLGNDV
ncbi:hypothetical protein TNCV_4319461 [Trichonephila clavipes]|nr:hypothetical protein TNCV_4319461 [Trichonephila clavipes]